MKTTFRRQRILVVVIFTLFASSLQAAEYYVVIGTFAEESNARNYTNAVRTFFNEASYAFSRARNLYYVHVLRTSKKEAAEKLRLHLKSENRFRDAWVLVSNEDLERRTPGYTAEGEPAPRHDRARQPRFEHGERQQVPEGHRVEDADLSGGPMIASAAPGGKYMAYRDGVSVARRETELRWTDQSGVGFISQIEDPRAVLEDKRIAQGQIFAFRVEDDKGREIPSEVMLVDFEKVRKIASFRTGDYAAIRGTRPGQMVALVCDILGYAQETRMYNIDHLSRGRDIRKNDAGVWEVRFRLRKMDLNDVAVLNRMRFYKDAAVLHPSSEQELEELYSLLKENPGYEIILHGHCNPGGKREITIPGTVTRHFDIEDTHNKNGSDKRLTKERVRAVRNYLVDRGISRKRIDVIGWGSLEPLVKSGGPDADMNERIEFELTAR